VEQNRIGDHICYYSDLRKMKAHYPNWSITKTVEETIKEIVESWQQRIHKD
jgi:CDP-paratose 2-epimerase